MEHQYVSHKAILYQHFFIRQLLRYDQEPVISLPHFTPLLLVVSLHLSYGLVVGVKKCHQLIVSRTNKSDDQSVNGTVSYNVKQLNSLLCYTM